MAQVNQGDKRQRERFLCDDRFGDTTVITDTDQFKVRSINFNHRGIGVFSMTLLPEETLCQLSFSFNLDDCMIVIEELSATLIYAHETEVGHQYGFRFELADAPAEAMEMLQEIENNLMTSGVQDRYGVFS